MLTAVASRWTLVAVRAMLVLLALPAVLAGALASLLLLVLALPFLAAGLGAGPRLSARAPAGWQLLRLSRRLTPVAALPAVRRAL